MHDYGTANALLAMKHCDNSNNSTKHYAVASIDHEARWQSVSRINLLSLQHINRVYVIVVAILNASTAYLFFIFYYIYIYNIILERCYRWPHVVNRHISISQLLSL